MPGKDTVTRARLLSEILTIRTSFLALLTLWLCSFGTMLSSLRS